MRQILCRARLAFGSPERSSLARCRRQSQLPSRNSVAPATPSRYKHLSVQYRLSVRTVLGGGATHRGPHVGRGIRRAAGDVGVALAVSVLGFASLLAAWFPAALPARPHSCASGVGLIRSGPDSYDFFQPLA